MTESSEEGMAWVRWLARSLGNARAVMSCMTRGDRVTLSARWAPSGRRGKGQQVAPLKASGEAVMVTGDLRIVCDIQPSCSKEQGVA